MTNKKGYWAVMAIPGYDGDGLGDGIEFTQLGTSVVSPDSDDDNILDFIEVNGYQDTGGVWWYLDPLTPDSNGDGVMDTLECPALVNPASGTACLDTDGDGAPVLMTTTMMMMGFR